MRSYTISLCCYRRRPRHCDALQRALCWRQLKLRRKGSQHVLTIMIERNAGRAHSNHRTLEQSQLLVGFMGRPSAVIRREITVLEKAFETTYESIDCGDRDITDVTIDFSRVQDYKLNRDKTGNSRPFTYFFDVDFKCKGCSRKDTLFSRSRDSLACPPPSEKEFRDSFDDRVKRLRRQGQLKNVFSLTDNFSELEEMYLAKARSQ